MDGYVILTFSIMGSFCLGYGLRRVTLGWENKASLAKAEAALQAEQLAATVSASLDGIIIIDLNGCIVDFSESAERIFGFNKQDILGENMAQLIVPERYRGAHDAGMARMRETGKANILGQRIEIEAMRANGDEFMSELAISRSRSSTGDIFIAYIRDISEAKAAETALRDAKDAAELANRAKTQFISAMSHEIRTPFNAVLGILDILSDSHLTHDQKQLVQTAEKTSQSLLRIINDVLDYARISSGSVKIVKDAFHAPDLYDDIYRLFAMQAKDKNIDLVINVVAADTVHLMGDIGRIRQVLMNFVSNAIKYTPQGQVELIVETQALPQSDSGEVYALICKVKDTGRGISKENQARLFDEFYMVEDVDTRATEGTGLGLTICKTLVRLMGGTIGVESAPEHGSTFWLKIPLEQAKPSSVIALDNTSIDDNRESVTPAVTIDGMRILLAEDNATNRMVVSRILERQGAILTQTINGIEALRALESSYYDLLLTDIFMPEMGGKELVETLRKSQMLNRDIPVIALTAMGDIHEAESLKDYGIDEVVLKPFNSKDLIATMAQMCLLPRGATAERPRGATAQAHVKAERLKPQLWPGQTEETADDAPLDIEAPDLSLYEDKFGDIAALKIDTTSGLLEGLDAEDLEAVKGQFELDLQGTSLALSAAIKAKDVEKAKFASHTLKGLAGLYGINRLCEIAALTNSNCSDDKIEQMVLHGNRAIKLADHVLGKLNDLFAVDEEAA